MDVQTVLLAVFVPGFLPGGADLRVRGLSRLDGAAASPPVFFTRHRISRWEGVVVCADAVAFTGYLSLHSTHHEAEGLISSFMAIFVILLIFITLLVCVLCAALRQGPYTGVS